MTKVYSVKEGIEGFFDVLFSTSKYWDIIRPYVSALPEYTLEDPSNVQKCESKFIRMYQQMVVLKTVNITEKRCFKVMSNGDVWLYIGMYNLNFSLAALYSFMKRFQTQSNQVFFTYVRLCLSVSPSVIGDNFKIYKHFSQLLAVASTWLRIKKFEFPVLHELQLKKTWYTKNGLYSDEEKPLEFFSFPFFFSEEMGIKVTSVTHSCYHEMVQLINWFDTNGTGKLDYCYDRTSLSICDLDFDEDLNDSKKYEDNFLFDTTEMGLDFVLEYKINEVSNIREFATSAVYKIIEGFTNKEVEDQPEIYSNELETTIYKSLSIGENMVVEDTSLRIGDDETGVDIKHKIQALEKCAGVKLQWISTVVARKNELALVVQQKLNGKCVPKRGKKGVGFDYYFQPEDSLYTISEMRDMGDLNAYDIRKKCFALFRAGFYEVYYIGILEPWGGRMQLNNTQFYFDHWFDRYKYEWMTENDVNAQWLKDTRWILYEWRVKYGPSQILYSKSKNLKLY
jgi:hypothetical protein